MKKITLMAVAIMAAFTTNAFAQQESSAFVTSEASVVTPITVTAGTALNFGTIAKGSLESVVTIDVDGIAVTTGDAVLVDTNGDAATAANFNVTGEAGYTFAITSPTEAIVLAGSGNATGSSMSFTATIPATGTLDATSGEAVIPVTAALTVATAQASGTYSNAQDLAVTVYYN